MLPSLLRLKGPSLFLEIFSQIASRIKRDQFPRCSLNTVKLTPDFSCHRLGVNGKGGWAYPTSLSPHG